MLILTWAGVVVGLALLLLMALGPVIVEIDAWWYARRGPGICPSTTSIYLWTTSIYPSTTSRSLSG